MTITVATADGARAMAQVKVRTWQQADKGLMPDAVAQLHKCVDNGAVTYQNMPSPASEPRQRPTLDQLNADRQKKLAQARAAAASSSAASATSPAPS